MILDFPRRKNNEHYFDVNGMGEGVAGGKFQLTDEAKNFYFCAVEKNIFSSEEFDLQKSCQTLIPAFGAVDRKKVNLWQEPSHSAHIK